MFDPLTFYIAISITALILSLFNTFILYFRKMISPDDIQHILNIINIVLEIAGINDDRIKNLIKELEEKYK